MNWRQTPSFIYRYQIDDGGGVIVRYPGRCSGGCFPKGNRFLFIHPVNMNDKWLAEVMRS